METWSDKYRLCKEKSCTNRIAHCCIINQKIKYSWLLTHSGKPLVLKNIRLCKSMKIKKDDEKQLTLYQILLYSLSISFQNFLWRIYIQSVVIFVVITILAYFWIRIQNKFLKKHPRDESYFVWLWIYHHFEGASCNPLAHWHIVLLHCHWRPLNLVTMSSSHHNHQVR